jgi:hypothetical protein
MGTNSQRVSFFIEWLTLRIKTMNANANLHQHALAAAP